METFAEFLFKLIKKKNLTVPEVYHKADLHRKTFSDIRNKKNYLPRRETIIKIIFALELSFDDAQKLLKKAGYAFSDSSDFDLTVAKFIREKNFSQLELDETLAKKNLPCLFFNDWNWLKSYLLSYKTEKIFWYNSAVFENEVVK